MTKCRLNNQKLDLQKYCIRILVPLIKEELGLNLTYIYGPTASLVPESAVTLPRYSLSDMFTITE